MFQVKTKQSKIKLQVPWQVCKFKHPVSELKCGGYICVPYSVYFGKCSRRYKYPGIRFIGLTIFCPILESVGLRKAQNAFTPPTTFNPTQFGGRPPERPPAPPCPPCPVAGPAATGERCGRPMDPRWWRGVTEQTPLPPPE